MAIRFIWRAADWNLRSTVQTVFFQAIDGKSENKIWTNIRIKRDIFINGRRIGKIVADLET